LGVATWSSRRWGTTVFPPATDAATPAIAIGEARSLAWPISAAARPFSVDSPGTDPKKEGNPTS
jgi:hypothetical protein